MNANGTGARRIATSARGPDWSPTGAGLAFENAAGAVVVAAADGKDAHDVVSNGADPAWSPDGTRLAFVRAGAIFVSGADGSDERLLVNSGAEPDWSPDGGRLVFARPARPNPGLEIMPVDGGAGRSLTAGFDSEPAWSPDGRSIAFTHCWNPHRNCPDDATVIRAIRPDGTGARTLSFADDEVYDSSPSWAPDSRRLVYASAAQYEDGGDSHLRLAPGARLLTRTPTPRAAVVIHARGGRVLARITPVGEALALAVTRTVTAVLVRGRSGVRVEIYAPHRRTIRLRRASARELAADGSLLAFRVGRTIYEIDARRGRAHVVARASTTPIGLSIVGRRIAWAENLRPGRARIRTLVRPR